MESLLGKHKKGLLFVMSAPAGTGKTTLIRKISEEFPEVIQSISYTTRRPREGEVNGTDYYFIDEKEFEKKIAAEDFLEYVKLYDTYYGTSIAWVKDNLSKGKHVFLVIDTQGARQLRGRLPATYIFIKPPSLEALRTRLVSRGTETEEMVAKRLKWAESEMKAAADYDYQIINDDLNTAYEELRAIVIAECHRITH